MRGGGDEALSTDGRGSGRDRDREDREGRAGRDAAAAESGARATVAGGGGDERPLRIILLVKWRGGSEY